MRLAVKDLIVCGFTSGMAIDVFECKGSVAVPKDHIYIYIFFLHVLSLMICLLVYAQWKF